MRDSFRPARYVPLALFIVGLTCWQNIYCTRQTPPGWQFSGITCDIVDQNTYLTFMAEARSGHFFLGNLYTGELEKPAYCNLFWWGLGTAARLTRLSLPAVFHASRSLLSFVFLVLLARFIRYFATDAAERWCAFVFISIGTGFGWLLIAFAANSHPFAHSVDLSVPEGFAVMSMLWKPHFVFALILQISILWLYLAACERGRWTWALGAALLTLLLGFTHAFHLVTIYFVTLVFGCLWAWRARDAQQAGTARWRALLYAALLIALSAPSLAYLNQLVRISPVMAAWQSQNVNLSPPLWSYLLGFGPLVLVLLLCPRYVVRHYFVGPVQSVDESPRNLLLFVWIVCNSALLYSGISFERRLVQGMQIPLTLLAVQVFYGALYPRIVASQFLQNAFSKGILSRDTSRGTLCAAWLLSGLPTTLYHFTATSFDALPPRSPYYLSPSQLAAAAYLRQHSAANAVILAPEPDGSWLPVQTLRHVFVGHPVQTVDYAVKSRLAKRFFSGAMSGVETEEFLYAYHCDYVYWPLRQGRQVPVNGMLEDVFTTGGVALYKVRARATAGHYSGTFHGSSSTRRVRSTTTFCCASRAVKTRV